MRRIVQLLIPALAALCLCSCGKSFQDIRVTSCNLVSLVPRGLTAVDATVDIGVDNPTMQVTLSNMQAVVKMDGAPFLYVQADDVTLAQKAEQVYTLLLHGTLADDFNPFMLLSLLGQTDYDSMTIDVTFHGALRSGLGKDFEYTDIPLKNLLSKI